MKFGKHRISAEDVIYTIYDALNAYRDDNYPQTEKALTEGGLMMNTIFHGTAPYSILHVVLDEYCCVLQVGVSRRSKSFKVVISLEDLMFQKNKESCPRSGNQYLAIINELNERVFSHEQTYGLYEDGEHTLDVTFKVRTDAATIPGLREMYVTPAAFRRTKWIANGGSFQTLDITEKQLQEQTTTRYKTTEREMPSAAYAPPDERPERDRSEPIARHRPTTTTTTTTLRLRDVIQIDKLRSKDELHLFFENVLKHSNPDIYDGSILVSDLADFVIGKRLPAWDVTMQSYVRQLIARMWYTYVVTNENSKSSSTAAEEAARDDVEGYNVPEIILVLAILSLLARDDCKTWYMDKLGIQICATETVVDNPCAKVREFQETQIGDLNIGVAADTDFKTHVQTLTNVKDTIRAIVSRSRRTADRLFTFFDAYVYLIIETAYYTSLESESESFTQNVCKTLIHTESD
jgi:hypothetical protein